MSGQNYCLSEEYGDLSSLKDSQVVVVMVPFPAHGHINQLLHLSHLITSYGIQVHCAGFAIYNSQAKLRVYGWDTDCAKKIHFHEFILPPFKSAPANNPDAAIHFPAHFQQISESVSYLRQPVYQLLQELSAKFRRIIIIHDNLMASVVQDLQLISNAESYTFLSVSAFTIFFSKWESMTEKPFRLDSDVPADCIIPSREGCFPPEFENFIINQHKLLAFESGRLFNTSRVIEGKYMELMEKLPTNANKKLFAIGPFNPVEVESTANTSTCSRHPCLKWLDKQEKDTVIYVSFGTVTAMSDKQVRELATGLERSQQKFIWVLRNPDTGDVPAEHDLSSPVQAVLLPDGFEQRVIDKGMVVRDWAPQLEILAHPATGGFISHCGWSSCIETVTMGVPIVAWPMHSDQPRNSILMTAVLKIGTLVRDWAQRADTVTAATAENAIRKLMTSEEGEEMRKRAAELGSSVRGSLSKGGSSRLELECFIAHITR